MTGLGDQGVLGGCLLSKVGMIRLWVSVLLNAED